MEYDLRRWPGIYVMVFYMGTRTFCLFMIMPRGNHDQALSAIRCLLPKYLPRYYVIITI